MYSIQREKKANWKFELRKWLLFNVVTIVQSHRYPIRNEKQRYSLCTNNEQLWITEPEIYEHIKHLQGATPKFLKYPYKTLFILFLSTSK